MKKYKFHELFEMISGVALELNDYSKNGSKILKIENIKNGFIDEYNCLITDTIFENKFYTKKGDILLALNRPIVNGHLKIGQVKECGNLVFQRVGIIRKRANNNYEDDYCFKILKKAIEKHALNNMIGGLIPFLKNSEINDIEFLMNENDSKKINKKLNNEINKIKNIKQLIEKIEIRNNYYADKLLSGELSIDEDGKIKSEEKETNILFVENLIIEYKKSKLDAKYGLKEGLYRFFKSSKEIYWSNDFIYEGEAVIMADGGRANVDYYNGKFSTSNHVYVFKSEKLNTKYFYYLLKSNIEKIEDCFQGAALKNLSKKQFKNMEIEVFEDINYQNNIVKFLDNLENEKSKVEKLLELEEQRFEWLSDKLLSGEYIIED